MLNYFLGVDGTPVDFDLTDIDIEFEEETEEVKKEISIIPRLMWTKEQVIETTIIAKLDPTNLMLCLDCKLCL